MEVLERRIVPALVSPVAVDDDVSFDRGNAFFSFVPLENDDDLDGIIDPFSLTIDTPPAHGQVSVNRLWDDYHSPEGDGNASRIFGPVDADGQILLKVTGIPDYDFAGAHTETGDYDLFVRFGTTDYLPGVFDARFSDSLTPGDTDFFAITGLTPFAEYIAWIDNTVGEGTPATLLAGRGFDLGYTVNVTYFPDPGYTGIDTFTYTVQDDQGNVSNVATVNIEVLNPPPVVYPVFVTTRLDTAVDIDVLLNAADDGGIDPSSLVLTSDPEHGTAEIVQTEFWPIVRYTPDPGFDGIDTFTIQVRDNEGAHSNITPVEIAVHNQPPVSNDDLADTVESTPVEIDVLGNDFDPDGLIDVSSLAIFSGPARGTVSIQQTDNGPIFVYTPDPGAATILVVDDPRDVDDGNTTTGNLSLREAIRLANSDTFTDVFSYTVGDNDGLVSNVSQVTVEVSSTPTTITFAPRLTAFGPANLRLSLVGDTSQGNSALVIDSSITIVGPAGLRGITLNGLGVNGDLRLFLVQTGSKLTLENLRLTRGVSDGNGGAIFVEAGAAVTLTNTTFSNNDAFNNGGAIYNFGTLTATRSTFSNNSAGSWGGAISNYGALELTDSTLSGNRADKGGGLYNELGTTTIVASSFLGNRAILDGGGFNNLYGIVDVTDSRFAGNSAKDGGGFFNVGTVNLTGGTINGNRADRGGGFLNGTHTPLYYAMAEIEGVVTLMGTTVSQNTARLGGGFYNLGGVSFSDGTIANNRAVQGGGFFASASGVENTFLRVTNSTISGNRANQGGGLFVDQRSVGLVNSTISNNSALTTGGGIFNHGEVYLENSMLTRNVATSGGGLYNGLGSANLIDSTVARNLALRGAGIFNDVGLVNLTNTTVSDSVFGLVVNTLADVNPPIVSAAEANAEAPTLIGYTTMPADTTEYRLNSQHQFWKRTPGAPWTLLETGIVAFEKTPNGDLYVLNDRRELRRLKLGYSWSTLESGVQTMMMDAFGTVFALNDLRQMHEYWSLDRYFILPEVPEGTPALAWDHPSPLDVMQAAAMSSGHDLIDPQDLHNDIQYFAAGYEFPLLEELSRIADAYGIPLDYSNPENMPARQWDVRSPYNNVRIVVEPTKDALDPPRFFAGVGMAQLHHSQFRCTIYYTALSAIKVINGVELVDTLEVVQDVFIDFSHLHQVDAPAVGTAIQSVTSTAPPVANASNANQALTATTSPPAPQRHDGYTPSLVQAPDGTIYLFAEGETLFLQAGSQGRPHDLWRLRPGSLWEQIGVDYRERPSSTMRYFDFAIGADSTLYILNKNYKLQMLRSSDTQPTTLAEDVQSFRLAPDGTLYALDADHILRMKRAGSTDWTTLDVGVSSFAMNAEGMIYALNDRGQFRRLTARGTWLTLDTGVQAFVMTEEGTIYELNGRGQLRRLTRNRIWSTIDTQVRSFQMAPDGTLYDLNERGELRQLSPRNHWTILNRGVVAFQIAQNGDLYALNGSHELIRKKIGADWKILKTDIESFAIYSNGTVYAWDSEQKATLYSSLGTYFPLAPILDPEHFAGDTPSQGEVVQAANIVVPPQIVVQYFPIDGQPLMGEGSPPFVSPPAVDRRLSSIAYPTPDILYGIDVRISVEPVCDEVEPPQYVAGIGPAQYHRALYKATIYYTSLAGAEEYLEVFIDHDHMHLMAGPE